MSKVVPFPMFSHILESSANNNINDEDIDLGKSFTYTSKSGVPKTLPCGMLECFGRLFEKWPWIKTKYDL